VSRAARLADRLRHAQAVAAEARASRDSVVTQLNDANSTITRLQEALTKSAAEDTRLMDAAWEIEKRARRAEDALRQTIKERDDARAANARQLWAERPELTAQGAEATRLAEQRARRAEDDRSHLAKALDDVRAELEVTKTRAIAELERANKFNALAKRWEDRAIKAEHALGFARQDVSLANTRADRAEQKVTDRSLLERATLHWWSDPAPKPAPVPGCGAVARGSGAFGLLLFRCGGTKGHDGRHRYDEGGLFITWPNTGPACGHHRHTSLYRCGLNYGHKGSHAAATGPGEFTQWD
jgi:hypothetical protein